MHNALSHIEVYSVFCAVLCK